MITVILHDGNNVPQSSVRMKCRALPILNKSAFEGNDPISLHRLRNYQAVEKLLTNGGNLVGPKQHPAAEARFQARLR